MSLPAAAGIGVVIVNWNSGAHLARCLASLAAQTSPAARVVVIDNDSRDGSLDPVPSAFPDYRLERLGRNAGFAEANNLGVATLDGCDWVFLLNPDAFPAATCLERLAQAIAAYPRISAFTPLIEHDRDPPQVASAGDACGRNGIATHRWDGLDSLPVDTRDTEVFSGSGAALLIRRTAFDEAGGFDADYFCYYEDVDLGFRLQLLGHRCLFVPGAVVRHVGGGTTGGRGNDHSLYYGHRNCLWTFLKDMPAPLFLRYLPLHLYAWVKNILSAACRGRLWLVLRATVEALRLLPKKLAERKRIQSRMCVDAAYIDSLLLR